jgi:hypothetical protein
MRKERRSRGKSYTRATGNSVPGEMKKPNTFSNFKLGRSQIRDDID